MDHPPDRVRNPLGLPWAVSIAVLVAIVAAQSIPFSLYQPYDRYPDMDLVVAYNALLINSGFPQEFLEHTGYLYFLLVAGWFRLLHSIGILSIVNLTALPPVADLAAFHSGWQQIDRSRPDVDNWLPRTVCRDIRHAGALAAQRRTDWLSGRLRLCNWRWPCSPGRHYARRAAVCVFRCCRFFGCGWLCAGQGFTKWQTDSAGHCQRLLRLRDLGKSAGATAAARPAADCDCLRINQQSVDLPPIPKSPGSLLDSAYAR